MKNIIKRLESEKGQQLLKAKLENIEQGEEGEVPRQSLFTVNYSESLEQMTQNLAIYNELLRAKKEERDIFR